MAKDKKDEEISVDGETQKLVKTELRKGSSNSRIAKLLEKPYEEAVKVIDFIKEDIRPEEGQIVKFTFRNEPIVGEIEKLLDNSAIIIIDWERSEKGMQELLEERTVVNFKDIEEFLDE